MVAGKLLEIQHLTMKFGGVVAIDDASLTLQEGHITALIGPNGAGKTTLFNCLTGFYKPTSGTIMLDDTNILHLSPQQRVKQAKIARTFQNIRLFNQLTVMENLLVALQGVRHTWLGLGFMPLYRHREKNEAIIACEWLAQVGLLEKADQPAGSLSYGEQRRLEIARALCLKPRLLCLDEPAAGLNPQESAELNALLLSLKKDHALTILLIEHDMRVVMQISDHIVVLNYGAVIANGTPAHIKQDKAVIAAYLGAEAC